MKIEILFLEIADSDFTGINISTPNGLYTNVELDEEDQELWPNQLLEKEVSEQELSTLIRVFELKKDEDE